MNHSEEVRARLRTIANSIKAQLPAGVGFALLTFADSDVEHRLEYISNCKREDIIKAMKEWLKRNEDPDLFGKHV